ncbi:MAG: ribosome biogenesis GTP-binding protein YsxC [Candidatus Binataceae bacterium]|nr:ribosome biogenesis GTP-binding protein YsxC [Candidatus Binataceae bacterium]
MLQKTQFVTSAFNREGCPRWDRVEIAFAGRSNVGKSSLLNALTGKRGLARTSRTPGRTRSLNFFEAGETIALVDLPGYGYAAMSHDQAAGLANLLRDYLISRRNLVALAMLIDGRRGPEREELELAAMAAERGIDLIVIATKCDKLRAAKRAALPKLFAAVGGAPILCSAPDAEGIEQLRRVIRRYADRGMPGIAIHG